MKNNYISKKYKNVIHIYDPVFFSNYYYVDVKTLKEFIEVVNKTWKVDLGISKDSSIGGYCTELIRKDNNISVVFWALPNKAYYLAHECIHAILYNFSDLGLNASNDNGEVLAYEVTFLMKEIEKYKGNRNGKNKIGRKS